MLKNTPSYCATCITLFSTNLFVDGNINFEKLVLSVFYEYTFLESERQRKIRAKSICPIKLGRIGGLVSSMKD